MKAEGRKVSKWHGGVY